MYIVDDTKVYKKDDMFKNFDCGLKKCIISLVNGYIYHHYNGDVSQRIENIYRVVNVADGNYSVVENSIRLHKFVNPLNEELKDANSDYVNACLDLIAINNCLIDFKNKQAEKEELKDYDIVIFNRHFDTLRVINRNNILYSLYLHNCLNNVKTQLNGKYNVFIRSLEKDTFDAIYKDLLTAKFASPRGINLIDTKEYGKGR